MMFVLPVGNMVVGPAVPKLFGETKIYYIDEVGSLVSAHDKVGWFDIPVDIIACVYEFYP